MRPDLLHDLLDSDHRCGNDYEIRFANRFDNVPLIAIDGPHLVSLTGGGRLSVVAKNTQLLCF